MTPSPRPLEWERQTTRTGLTLGYRIRSDQNPFPRLGPPWPFPLLGPVDRAFQALRRVQVWPL